MTDAWTPALYREPTDDPGRRLTVLEWGALPEDSEGELVGGRLVQEEVPDPIHELAVSWLVAMFREWLRREGFVFGSDVRLGVSPTTGRRPDLSVFLPGRSVPRRGLLRSPPDIVVEVVTPTPRDERRDRVEKMSEYAAFGVRFYWIVDPALGSVEIFELGADARYSRAVAATEGRISVPGCAGLSIDVDALWSELDRLDPEPD